jgi:Tfp pilus assembly protein PilV
VISRTCPPTGEAAADGGFALVDALVALLLLSTTLIFCLDAVTQANRAAKAAAEVRRANTLLANLIDTAPSDLENDLDGRTDGFDWRFETRTTGAERPIIVCRRLATAENRQTHRRYQISTLETCPPTAPA